MELKQVKVDGNYRETVKYHDAAFPFLTQTDSYRMYIDNTVNCHWHGDFEFSVILDGEVEYYINETHLHLATGDGVFVNTNAMHMAKQSEGYEDSIMFSLVFPASLLDGSLSGSIYQKYIQPVLQRRCMGCRISPDVAEGRRILDGLLKLRAMDLERDGYELQFLSLLYNIWQSLLGYLSSIEPAAILGGETRHSRRARQMLTYIHAHYSETITVDDIARAASVSRSECFRCFKRITNKKPVEYLNEYRLAQAAHLLLETNNTVADICSSCGFTTSSYFGKLFRDYYGASPLRFRKDRCQSA